MTHDSSALDRYLIQLKAVKTLGNDYFELMLSRPDTFCYIAGQRIRFLESGLERDYSLISTPADQDLAIYVRLIPDGKYSPRLVHAALGTHFNISGPHGHFRFYPSRRKAVFIATGTGLAPFVAFARSGIEGITLLHGIKVTDALHYDALFTAANINYIACLSNANLSLKGKVTIYHGSIEHYLSHCLPKGIYDFYVCGGTVMIRDVTQVIDHLFPDSHLFYETFY